MSFIRVIHWRFLFCPFNISDNVALLHLGALLGIDFHELSAQGSGHGDEFAREIEMLGKFLTDRYIDRFESKNLCDMIGNVLTTLRQAAASEQVCQG